jgi:hypothetical protein
MLSFLVVGDAGTNDTADLELLGGLDIKGGIEGQDKIAVLLDEEPLEGLLEDGGVEGVGEDHKPAGPAEAGLHFQQSHLVITSHKQVNDVARVRGPLGQGLVVLGGLLQVLGVILLNVMVGAHRLLQLISNNNAGTLGAGTPTEQHDPGPSVGESELSKPIQGEMLFSRTLTGKKRC